MSFKCPSIAISNFFYRVHICTALPSGCTYLWSHICIAVLFMITFAFCASILWSQRSFQNSPKNLTFSLCTDSISVNNCNKNNMLQSEYSSRNKKRHQRQQSINQKRPFKDRQRHQDRARASRGSTVYVYVLCNTRDFYF